MKYTVSEIKPRIFFLKFKWQYDLCMHFLRYQEFYESPNPKFRGKPFEILDFMEWYSSAYGKGCFTYPIDWGGFNHPGEIIKQVWDLGIADRNIHDYEMLKLYKQCLEKYPDGKFYIIGACGNKTTMRHEVAHGLFYINPEYKKEMTALVRALDKDFYRSICKSLKKMGYASKVHLDECQAYLATGMFSSFVASGKLTNQNKPFVKLFNQYYKNK